VGIAQQAHIEELEMSKFLSFFLIIALSGMCLGQSESATLSGRVTDPSGSAVVGAEVVLTNTETNVEMRTKTNSAGLYVFTGVHPGKYRVAAGAPGFKVLIKEGLLLHVQDEFAENFALTLGTISETVTVTADAMPVNTTDASVSTVIDRNFVENLPLNGRSFQTLIQLTPGVVLTGAAGADFGQFSVNGQRSTANYLTVDGVSANIGVSAAGSPGQAAGGALPGVTVLGGMNNLVSVDALQEFRIQTSTFAPEFGRTPGAQISIVTRPGTNQFHGNLFDYFRNDILDGNDWFANHNGLPKSQERQNDFGGTLGGPIWKNHTFFFLSYEGLRLRLPQVALTTVPCDNTCTIFGNARQSAGLDIRPFLNAYPLPNGPEVLDAAGNPTGQARFNSSFSNRSSLDAGSIRIDHTVGNNVLLFGRYTIAPSELVARGIPGNVLSTLQSTKTKTQTTTIGVTWIAGPNLTNDFRINYSRNLVQTSASLDSFGGAVVPSDSTFLPAGVSAQNSQFGFAIATLQGTDWSSGRGTNQIQRQWNLVNTVADQIGAHALKFGVDYRRLSPVFQPINYQLVVGFDNVLSTVQQNPSPLFVFVANSINGSLLFRDLGLFAQDTWRISPHLTATYGLRWDLELPPTTTNGPPLLAVTGFDNLSALAAAPLGTPVWKTRYRNFAPRVGVAYQLFSRTEWQTVLRAGFGVFYDLVTQQVGDAAVAGSYPYGASNFQTTNLSFPLTAAETQPPDISIASLATSSPLIAFDPHLQQPYTLQWNVALEQSIGARQIVSVTYVGAAGRRLIQPEAVPSPNPNVSFAELVQNSGSSDYDALQVEYQRRLYRGLQVLASYSLGHAIDTASGSFLLSNASFFVSGLSANINRGPADFDIRHSFSAAISYDLPHSRKGLLHPIMGDWSIDNIIQARSALPLNVSNSLLSLIAGQGSSTFLATVRPDLVSGQSVYLSGSQYPGGKALNPLAFTNPPTDPNTGLPLRQGDLGRNALRGFGAAQWDFAIRREFKLHEALHLQFKAEFFNILNHPNFANPQGDLSSPFFGQSTTTLARSLGSSDPATGSFNPIYQFGGPRSIQLSLKFHF